MDVVCLSTYIVMSNEDMDEVMEKGTLLRGLVDNRNYIGLREDLMEAVTRAGWGYSDKEKVTKHTHAVLQVNFTAAGIAYYTKLSAGRYYNFKSCLHKKVFPSNDQDWKVWHFLDDLPLRFVHPTDGTLLVKADPMSIL